MKKLFAAICFVGVVILSISTQAGVREILDQAEFNRMKFNSKPEQLLPTARKNDIPTDKDEFIEYVRERAKKAVVTSFSEVEQNSGMSIIHSNEYIAQQSQNEKSTFQKIYEEALNRVSLNESYTPNDILPSSAPSDGKLRSEIALQNNVNQAQNLGFDVINVKLPNGKTVQAPAKEHIPYMTSKIEIMPNGLVRIKENVTVIANGQKLKYGLSKALPKYSVSRDGVRNSIIPYLNGVKINGTEIEYTLKDGFDRFLITPKKQFPLQPGIYTYEFDYILDRKLWYYDQFNEFYWDVTGSFWNLAITQAIATVRLPINVEPLGQNLMVGYLPDNITEEGTVITKNTKTNSLGFTSSLPLFAGEGMFMLIRIPKSGFIDPDFNKKLKWLMEDYGDILLAILGFIAIFTAYLISWKNIDKSSNETSKINFERTPALYRMLAKGVYDKISFGAFLLDMYRRGIININKDDSGITISKQSKISHQLYIGARKALGQIFSKKDNSLLVTRNNIVRLRNASKFIEKDTNKRLKWLLMKLNAGYVFFSCLMILLVELAMAYMHTEMWSTFGVLVASTITIAVYCLIFKIKINNKYIRIAAKTIAILLISIAALFMSNYIHLLSVILIIAMIATIFTYTKLFAKREGLIRYNIMEAQQLAQKLKDEAEKNIFEYQFSPNQPNIFALDAGSAYPKLQQIEQIYKMDVVQEILVMM